MKQVLEGNNGRSIKHRLADFLFRYRTTPRSTTGATPAKLLMRRRLRTRLMPHSHQTLTMAKMCLIKQGIRSHCTRTQLNWV